MQSQILAELRNGNSLPSLPAIAVRLIELTQDPNVSLSDLSEMIKNDQALSVKLLRTVNSSYFGLRQRCGSIERALAMLGLNAVRNLALGFSLVDSVGDGSNENFDYVAYWRRGLLTAMSAQSIADSKKLACRDQAFLGGLLQDVGMVVLHRALGTRYEALLNKSTGVHASLLALEINNLETHHADVGAMLTESWKLPSELTLCVRYHERPTAAPQEVADLVRCVALGNLVHDVLVDPDPTDALRSLYTKAKAWMSLTSLDVDDILVAVGESAEDVSEYFSLEIGSFRSPELIVAEAERQMMGLSRTGKHESYAERGLESELTPPVERDGLTGAIGSHGFLSALRAACPDACAGNTVLTVAQFVLDKTDELISMHGPESLDEAVVGAVAQLRIEFEPMGGIVCRLAPTIFGVVLPGTAREPAARAAERFREQLPLSLADWLDGEGAVAHPLRVSAGVASIDEVSRDQITNASELMTAATEAIKAARASGGNAVHSYTSRAAAA